ncbi:MAG: PhoH family protein [Rhodospirillales bacterium]|nr:PhoH family protein [Rhodospirillales bacterium]
MSRPASGAPGEAGAQISFDDNTLLPLLFGDHDRHLVRIEHALGVVLRSRGNEVAISGPPSSVAATEEVLRTLYDKLKQGLPMGGGEVEGAIRMATGPGGGAAGTASPRAEPEPALTLRTRKRPVSPRSPRQADYVRAMQDNDLVFGLGPAGTGKTYLAVAMAVSLYLTGRVERIVLSRPAVEAGERLGFLPGDLKDKVDPYLRPLYDALYDMLPADLVSRRIDSSEIEIAPLAFMRGRTLSQAFIILDEAQNTTPLQMKMFLTRLGEGSRMVVTGDLTQVDLPTGAQSGLRHAVETLEGMDEVAFVRFGTADVMRHSLVTRILEAYDAETPGDDRDRDQPPRFGVVDRSS